MICAEIAFAVCMITINSVCLIDVFFTLNQACKLAIRESIEADIRRERELRDNPDQELVHKSF